MNRIEYRSPNFPNTDVQAAEVTSWRQSYEGIIAALGTLGTEVRVDRILETDQDVQPTRFIRRGCHQFVFPRQQPVNETDNSAPIDASPGYGLHHQDITRDYDPSRVKGMLEVHYDDANSHIDFSVSDVMEGESRLDERVLTALSAVEQTIATFSLQTIRS